MQQYSTYPVEMDIMKYLALKEHYCSLSGGLYPGKRSNDCTLA